MTQTENLLYQRYRLISLAVNVGVLLAGLLDWLYTGLGAKSFMAAPESLRIFIFVVAVLALIGLDFFEVGRKSFAKSTLSRSASSKPTISRSTSSRLAKGRIIPFVARLLLFIVACLVTDLSYSKILFLPILLYSYLAISQRLSYLLAIIGVTTLLAFSLFNVNGIGLVPPPPRPNPIPNTASPRNRPSRSGRLLDESMGLLITLFFTLLLARAISQSTQAQQRLTKLLASLEASHMQLQQYSTRVADLAATEERNRLARDIHDSLGHHLAAINIQLEKANAYRERDPKRAREAVNLAQHTVQDALKDVRASVSSLRKGSEPFLFGESLNDLIDRMRHSELMIVSSQSGDSSRYSRLKLMTLYRVVQEGLTNVHKHAHATQVTIEIAFDDRQVTLSLRDDGDGFDVKAWKTRNNKQMTEQMTQGLIGLQERLSLVGGTLSITSYPYDGYAPNLSSKRSQRSSQNLSQEKTQGTTLTVCIPRSNSYLHSNTEVRS